MFFKIFINHFGKYFFGDTGSEGQENWIFKENKIQKISFWETLFEVTEAR